MGNTPYISIVMPVYNAQRYIEAAVESLLSQTFGDFELICVNDCSTDDSLSVLRRLEQQDARIRVIDSPENVGAGRARNLALAEVRGVYTAFLDADDTIEPTLYEKAVAMTDNGTIDYVTWGLTEEHYDANNNRIRSVPILPRRQVCVGTKEIMPVIVELERDTLFGYLWNSLYKTEIIRENGLLLEDALFYEDYFFNLAFAEHIHSMAVLDCVGQYYYKRVNASVTHSFSAEYYELSHRRVADMLAFCEKRQHTDRTTMDMLAEKLLRYTLSALSRNCDVRSNMDHKARRAWFYEICRRPLYTRLFAGAKVSNPVFVLLKWAIKRHSGMTALTLGRVVNILRR